MNNGTSEKLIEHFNKVAMLPDVWDHNQQYQKYMLLQVKRPSKLGLDIGCGTGEFTSKLSKICDKVIGIDIAPVMINEANKRNSNKNIKYVLGDVNSYLDKIEESLDVIVSIATFHHLDYEEMLRKSKESLKKGGVLIIQDLYHENTILFKFLSLIGVLLNPLYMLLNNRQAKVNREHQKVWKNHHEDDFYNSIKEIKAMADHTLLHYKIRRHIFWRYTLTYYKE
jgi:SAM-dependent methyltransferase